MTKKKPRQQQRHGRKQRELEESAACIGFLDDLEEQRAVYADDHATEDPEFAEELDAVEWDFLLRILKVSHSRRSLWMTRIWWMTTSTLKYGQAAVPIVQIIVLLLKTRWIILS